MDDDPEVEKFLQQLRGDPRKEAHKEPTGRWARVRLFGVFVAFTLALAPFSKESINEGDIAIAAWLLLVVGALAVSRWGGKEPGGPAD